MLASGGFRIPIVIFKLYHQLLKNFATVIDIHPLSILVSAQLILNEQVLSAAGILQKEVNNIKLICHPIQSFN